jgi:hypothetical protein
MAKISMKHLQIDKSNSRMVLVVALASFFTIFFLLSSKTLYHQMGYQNRVATAQQTALNQLTSDEAASKQLESSYTKFVNTTQNIIGGSVTGDAGNSGYNGKIVLDALPSTYDYPALTSSIEYLLSNAGVNIDNIGGTDEQADVASNGTLSASPDAPTPTTGTAVPGTAVAMPFTFSVDGPYANIQNLLTIFQTSIRPFQFQSIDLTGSQNDLTLTATVQSFYQPAQKFNITTEAVE